VIAILIVAFGGHTGRQKTVNVVEGVQGKTDLAEIALAAGAAGGFARLLHGRQQQRQQNADDGDHYQ
jgi:hypothetical protein